LLYNGGFFALEASPPAPGFGRDSGQIAEWPVDNYAGALDRGVKDLRVGLDEKYVADGTSPEVADAVIEAVRELERLGVRVVKIKVPDVTPCIAVWMAPCGPEAAAAHEATYLPPLEHFGYNPVRYHS